VEGQFEFDRAGGTAEVHPPEPFIGGASYDSTLPVGEQWQGNLSVEYLGLGRTALAGPRFKASLAGRNGGLEPFVRKGS
jgi:hypothetical protein